MSTFAARLEPGRSRGQRLGIRALLLAANSVVVIVSIATTTIVAAAVGPPMFRKIMATTVTPGLSGDHPYERAFRHATSLSVGAALAVSALAAMALSWYLSRRMHRSATELSHAATAIANGRYDIRVPPPRLGKEFDQIALAFNTMAQRLGDVEGTRRQLLADLAHEIRTPVSVLEGYMEALEDGVQRLDRDTISMLRDQTRRLTRFSVDVNALSSAEQNTTSIDARWVCLEEAIGATLTTFTSRYAAKGVALECRVAAGLPPMWADPERLGQVLSNLLDNALRHTHRGDRVRVLAHATDHHFAISVSDTGDGVPAEHLSRLFDRFYRVDAARDREHGGAGIGLAIAKALVEAHHGQIVASSGGLGAGCTFTVTLPRQRAAVERVERVERVG